MKFNIEKFLEDNSIHFSVNGTNSHFILNECPFCHGKGKFYIDRREGKRHGKFVCHKCSSRPGAETKGNIVKLVSILGNVTYREAFAMVYRGEISEEDRNNLFSVHSLSFLHQNQKADQGDQDLEPIKIPPFLKKLSAENTEAMIYLKDKRGLSDKDIAMMDIYVTESNDYKTIFERAKVFCDGDIKEAKFWTALRGRICFTVRRSGRVYGLVCRDYTGKATMKVLNSKGSFRNSLIWNMDRARESKLVIIAEGIISAAKCGVDRSVATLGKFITSAQFSELFKLPQDTTFIVVSDPDEEEVAEMNASTLQSYFANVHLLNLPHTKAPNGEDYLDAGDYSFEENDRRINDLLKSGTETIRVANHEVSFSPRKLSPFK